MSRYDERKDLIKKINGFDKSAKILDLGGWFDPFKLATHIVDYFPYETRNVSLNISKIEGENFSKETWYQADFLDPNFKLPFEDQFFDFTVCCHTLEDLQNPVYLLQEIKRVSKQGYLEIPSRFSEQTIGTRDRASNLSGHPHHHWIIDSDNDHLIFYSKEASISGKYWKIPLTFFEKVCKENSEKQYLGYYFNASTFGYKIENDSNISRKMADNFTGGLNINNSFYLKDNFLRFLRRTRNWILNKKENYDWYTNIVKVSQPYSTFLLK